MSLKSSVSFVMEKDQDQKHKCKFCSKSFPCGRSLGGHMRSHLISLSPSDRRKSDEKLPKKKLRPLVKPDPSMDGGDQLGSYGLRDNPKKTRKFVKTGEEDALLQEKACKECGKSFQSWKALFGHMKCHSVNGKVTANVEEDSWQSYDHDHDHDHHDKLIMDSQSDNEAATPFLRRKRSDRMIKRYTSNTNSSSLTEIDHQEEEEVALSLIILSRDKGKWGGVNSFDESSDHSFELIEADQAAKVLDNDSKSSAEECLKIKKLKQIDLTTPSKDKKTSRKRKSIEFCSDSQLPHEIELTSKFACSICKKAFQSYQALGGHRASHKKFKGLCAPRSENSLETEHSHIQTENLITNKGHECPICFKVFSSGQALGGHKRSHLIVDQSKSNPTVETEEPVQEIRGFLDLNLPAPHEEEEECNEFKPWWIATGHQPQPLIGLLSS